MENFSIPENKIDVKDFPEKKMENGKVFHGFSMENEGKPDGKPWTINNLFGPIYCVVFFIHGGSS